jgi:hypothetical protein
MTRVGAWTVAMLLGISVGAQAQWINYVPAGTQIKDGKPNLTAPAPRTVDRKPDLSGVWQAEPAPIPELIRALPGGENGLGEDIPNKYFIDIFFGMEPGKEPLQPAAAAAAAKLSLTTASNLDTSINCLPAGVPLMMMVPAPFKIVQTRGLTLMLSEADTSFRQIFTDGRPFPADPQPSWMGSSIGRWEGDTFVVETIGFNDRGQLDAKGHVHSDALRITERYRRRDYGHLDAEITFVDPKVFTQPVTIKFGFVLRPTTDLIEYFCAENEKDREHLYSPKATQVTQAR